MGIFDKLRQHRIKRELAQDQKLKKQAIREEAAAARAERRKAITDRIDKARGRRETASKASAKSSGGFIGFLEGAAEASEKMRGKVRRTQKAVKKIRGSTRQAVKRTRKAGKKAKKRARRATRKPRRRKGSSAAGGFDFSPF